jgi:hypothetical protein
MEIRFDVEPNEAAAPRRLATAACLGGVTIAGKPSHDLALSAAQR